MHRRHGHDMIYLGLTDQGRVLITLLIKEYLQQIRLISKLPRLFIVRLYSVVVVKCNAKNDSGIIRIQRSNNWSIRTLYVS